MGSIFFDVLRKISEFRLSEIAVYPERCIDLRWEEKRLCSVCKEQCATDAVEIDGGVNIDWSRCIRCGVCAAVCPTEVFKIQSPSDNTLLNGIVEESENGRVVIECNFGNGRFQGEEKHPRSEGRKITVPCVGRFSETFILKSILAGGDRVEFVKCTHDCSFTEGRSAVEEAWRRTEHLLKIFKPDVLKGKEGTRGAEGVSERRRLLRETGLQAIKLLLPHGGREVDSSPSRSKAPPHRADLIELVKRYASSSVIIDREKMPFGGVRVDMGRCRLHGVCASVCPTGALRFSDDSQGKELIFMYGLCVGCEVCVYACPEGALMMDKEVDLALLSSPWKTIMARWYRFCTSCGKQFTVKMDSESSICQACVQRWSTIEKYAEDSKS